MILFSKPLVGMRVTTIRWRSRVSNVIKRSEFDRLKADVGALKKDVGALKIKVQKIETVRSSNYIFLLKYLLTIVACRL
jgi:hypothetical protein